LFCPLIQLKIMLCLNERYLFELELELIQIHMTQKPMLRVEVGAVSYSRCACVAHKGHARENRGAWANAAFTYLVSEVHKLFAQSWYPRR
jgi:hypothetical protein